MGVVSRSFVAVVMGYRRSAIPAGSGIAASTLETSREVRHVAVIELTREPLAFRREMPSA